MSRLSQPETVSADEADSLRLTIRELRAEVELLRFKNQQLVTAGKSLVRALRFSSEWGDAFADLEDLVGETK